MSSKHCGGKFAGLLVGLLVLTTGLSAAPPFTQAAGSPIRVGTRPTGVATADFNGDGKQDIAVTNSNDNTVTILLGNGAGGFAAAPGSPVAVGAFPYAVLAKDFNKDGKMDLAVVQSNAGSVAILLGNGAGGFAAAAGSPFSVGTNPEYIATGDFNGDTIPDLVVSNLVSHNLTILLGTGSGAFTQPAGSPYAAGTGPASVVTLDANKDGKTDIAVSDYITDFVTILLGDGAGGFAPGSSNEGASHATVLVGQASLYGMTSGDFLNRGITDLVTGSYGTNEINFLKGDGAGDAIYNSQYFDSGPLSVISGDFDGDGNLDIAAVSNNSQLLVLQGNGAGSFAALPVVATGINPYGLATADFNGDGHLDLVVSNQNDYTLTILLGGPAPVAPPVVPPVVPPAPPVTPPAPAPQTISFTIPDHLGTDQPFVLQATASSGLPVSFSVVTGPATLSGSTLTLTGLGTVTVEASQSGNAMFAPAFSDQSFNVTLGAPSIKSIVNGASLVSGAIPAGSDAALFGANLVTGSSRGDPNRDFALRGTAVTIVDAAKNSFSAGLALMSFAQINFVMPTGVAPGQATATVTNSSGKSASMAITVSPVFPGLFSADGTGAGIAATEVVAVSADGSQTILPGFGCSPFQCSANPIAMPLGTQVYLVLYGTAIRGLSGMAGVSAKLGETPATVTYAGPQGGVPGLDQVDILVPPSMAGAGLVDVKLTVDGIAANTLKVNFK